MLSKRSEWIVVRARNVVIASTQLRGKSSRYTCIWSQRGSGGARLSFKDGDNVVLGANDKDDMAHKSSGVQYVDLESLCAESKLAVLKHKYLAQVVAVALISKLWRLAG